MSTPQDPLDSLLDRWRETPPAARSDSLAPEVWRRIAATETASRPGWFARVVLEFARPAFAVTFAAACVLLGLFLAEVRVSRLQRERNAEMAKSYLRLIDPLLTVDSNRGTSAARHS
jgi:hypothetical protein